MTQKEREEGASHTLLTVGLTTYQHILLLSNTHYSAALLIPFDRRWLISFMAFVLMTQTYKRLLKLKWGLQKLKWLIFDCCRKTNHLRYIWTDPLYIQNQSLTIKYKRGNHADKKEQHIDCVKFVFQWDLYTKANRGVRIITSLIKKKIVQGKNAKIT